MNYSPELYRAAVAAVEAHKRAAEQTAEQRREQLRQTSLEIATVLDELAQTGPHCVHLFLSGQNVHERMDELRKRNLALQARLKALLAARGLPENYLQPAYSCPLCGDTGYIDGKMCDCLKMELRRLSCEELNRQAPLSLSTFESFSLRYYAPQGTDNSPAPRAVMEHILHECKQYTAKFNGHAPSLLFQGGTGLGKTHLSLAIANEVLQKGYGVVYGSAPQLATMLEQERFGEKSDDTRRRLLSCDLLILDDLGTEFQSSFTNAAFYDIINSRLLTGRPTIISTNLSLKELESKYGSRIVSRMIGSYEIRPFYGSDVRQQLRRQRMTGAQEMA